MVLKQAVGGREELLDDWERTPVETAKKFSGVS